MRALVLLLLLLLPTTVRAEPFPSPPNSETTFEQLAEWTRMFDRLYDRIPKETYPTLTTDDEVQQWINEVVPFFSYERVTDPEQDLGEPFGAQYPESVNFVYYETDLDHNHLLGTANCFSNEITLNARMRNPQSPFFMRDDMLVVLVHELGHVQGICFGSTRLDDEVSTHLATLEVLAAMVNRGNTIVLGPLVAELRDMALASAQYAAMRDGVFERYLALEAEIVDSPLERAFEDKSRRYWAHDPELRLDIVRKYNYAPLNELRIAFGQACVYRQVALDEDTNLVYTPVRLDAPCVNGVYLPINWSVYEKPLIVDDLSYFFRHADEFVGELYGETQSHTTQETS